MNRREARRFACRWASAAIQNVIDSGNIYDVAPSMTEADAERVERELDDIAQRLWERGNPAEVRRG